MNSSYPADAKRSPCGEKDIPVTASICSESSATHSRVASDQNLIYPLLSEEATSAPSGEKEISVILYMWAWFSSLLVNSCCAEPSGVSLVEREASPSHRLSVREKTL